MPQNTKTPSALGKTGGERRQSIFQIYIRSLCSAYSKSNIRNAAGRSAFFSEKKARSLSFLFLLNNLAPQQISFALAAELVRVEVVVVTALGNELAVRAFFDDLAVVYDQNAIGGAYCGQTVRYNEARAPFKRGCNGALYCLLGLRVDR